MTISRRLLAGGALAAILLMLLACGGPGGAETSSPVASAGEVKGLVVEVVGRNISEIETLRIRTPDEKVWTFTSEGPLEFSPSHLREHQLFGQVVIVSYKSRGDVLVAIEIGD
jgi:hypothetical protein